MKIGADIVEISRIEKSLQIKGFKESVYSASELEFLSGRKVESYAANFAAKEAFSKSLGTGIQGFSLNEISVLRDSLGAPYISLSGRALDAAKGFCFTVSLSHTKDTALAVVIAYEDTL